MGEEGPAGKPATRGSLRDEHLRRSLLALFGRLIELPGVGSRQDLGHELRVESVTGAGGVDLADDRSSEKREVAQEVENLVADELVAKTQRAVHDTAVVEDDAVLHVSSASQTGGT